MGTRDLTQELVRTFQGQIAFLRTIPMFANLEDAELGHLCRVASTQRYAAGAVLLAEGQHNDALYLVCRGKVGLFHPAAAQHPFLELERGRFFGQVSMFDPGPSSATVRALPEVEAMCLRARPLADLSVHQPGAAMRLLRAIIQDLARRHRSMLQRIGPPVGPDERHHL